MNGVQPGASAEQRQARKRELLQELTLVRQQKADILRQLQVIAKKQRTVGPPPKASGLPPETRRQAIEVDHHRRVEGIWQACMKIMQDLLKNATVKLYFGEPVRLDYAPTYYDVIKNPMDLGTIKRKLETKKYMDVYGFLSDVRLTFDNCRVFNPVGNHVRVVGDDASDKFEKKWVLAQIEPKWEEEMARYHLELERLEAESKSLPEKMKEVTAELAELTRKAEARAHPPPPGPGRDMTFEEKRKLSHALSSLGHERLTQVMEVVSSDPTLAGREEEEEEFELDLDVLGRETLWKLHAIVEEAHAASKPPPSTAAAANAGGAAAAPPASAGAGGGAQAAAAAADGAAQRPTQSNSSSDGSDSEEVGSKGNAGSTFGDQGENKKAHLPPGGHDLTTFVSATGPGMQPQILKNTGHKKDVQLQNANAWASLTAAPAAAPAVPPAAAAQQPEAAGAGEGEEEEEDNLWSEFQGREQQQRQQEEQKKALEEEERRKKEAEAEAARKQAEEAKAAKQREEQERQQAIEQQREREAAQLQNLQKAAAEESNQPDLLRNVGHESGADLAALGLMAKEDDDELMEEEDI